MSNRRVLIVLSLLWLFLQQIAAAQNPWREKLEQRTSFKPTETPLRDMVEFFSDRFDMNIQVDQAAFRKRRNGTADDLPVQLGQANDVRLGTVLDLLVRQVDATYVCEK